MRSFSNFIRNRDAMGHPVTLNFKGNDTNPTILGGIISVAVRGLVVFFLFQLFLSLKNMDDPSI